MPRVILTPQDKDSLVEIADRIEKLGPQIKAIVTMMKKEGFDSIDVVNYFSFIKGVEAIEDFTFRAKRSVLEMKHSRGDYVAGNHEPPKISGHSTYQKIRKSNKK